MVDHNFLTQEEIDALFGRDNMLSDENEPSGDCQAEAYGEQEVDGEQEINLDLIMDFPLQVSVRLGKVERALREFMLVGPGTIIELDRFVNDPVDIFINGKLIGKGEVIVIEESFGVKITNIIAPLERIKKLS